ncbi:unnamed protein product [Rotaria sordida]|uniref:ADP ribosyltransferase domain-containing protein n=1 Tax=Rotaria sordida TaxID=392033 RepID=A0A819VJ40_9BILA|nr:unnamed protein product [Rotaria sordida]CAF1060140.1 unnamed protein product [Rotaria sordida]CAF4010065.1 unnamed protein product [Rotaria sordida]CAF4109615.1 unnamed protein product [Rotaria sordida]
MDDQKSTTTAAIERTAATTSSSTVPSRRICRMIQNFLLVWLDANIDESKEDFKNSLTNLRHIVATITTFTDADQCVDFLRDIEDEKVFMIVSGVLGQNILPDIQALPQLHSIYVFCENQSIHEQWAKKTLKVKGVYAQIEPICEALKIDREYCDRGMIPISYHGIDVLFMYTQLLKEALLEIEDDDTKSIKELVEYCRLQDDVSEQTIEKIEREYRNHTPIWWYTGPYFIYSMLNRGLRQMDVDIILKMGFFIRHLHQHITELHREQQSSKAAMPSKFQVFRGQGLSMKAFEKMKKTEGGLMSFNNFLSTSRNREISFQSFARPAAFDANSVGILFVMSIDTTICTASSTPFVNVKDIGFYDDKEEEILFSTHTIFRIDRIERIEDKHTDRLWQVNLTLAGNQDNDFNRLTVRLREELDVVGTGWSRLGQILIKVGDFEKAGQLYQLLLEKTSSDGCKAQYNCQLGTVYQSIGGYSKAITFYEKAIDIYKEMNPPSQLGLAATYQGMGNVYYNMGEYLEALSSYERSLEIRKIVLPPNHFDLTASYNNIGMVYDNMGEYPKALSSYERSLEIQKIALPPNHPDLAMSYNNIGLVYNNMGEYLKALSYYETSLHISKEALPPNHPNFAEAYNNIGVVYSNMGEYSKAISSCERSIEIRKTTLPPSHPDLATSHNNISLVYSNMGEYSKALSSCERSLEIRKTALPSSHPDLATSYNNISLVYSNMGEYSKALSSCERSLEIRKIALPSSHPDLATSYNNNGLVYSNMGEYPKALSLCERSLEIRKIALPSNHPDLATSYNNIGHVYYNMGEYSKALRYYEKAQEIWQKSLPPTHPHIALVKSNIEIVKKKM